MSAADEIKSRLDIVSYIQQSVPLKKAGRTYKACCPFHSEKTPSFVVDPARQTWRCYGACATGGDVINFAMRQHGWTFTEALEELARQTGVQLKKRTPQQRQEAEYEEKLRGLLHTAAEQYHRWLTDPESGPLPHRQAMWQTLSYAREKRGLAVDTLAKFQIGYALNEWTAMTDHLKLIGYSEDEIVDSGMAVRNEQGRVYDRFRNRLMIPIRDERGRVIGFGARALDPEDNPKYLNTPETGLFNKSRILYGLDTAKQAIRDEETVVIVEGYLDVIQAQQAGYENVVAQMGTALTDSQLKLVAPRFAKRVLLALDSDVAGQNATMRSLEVARRALAEDFAGKLQIDIRVLDIPGAKDPDDLIRESPQEWPRIIEAARPVADFVIDFEMRDLPPNASIVEKEQVAKRVLPLLMASEHNLYRQDNLQKLAVRLRIAENTLLTWAAAETREAKRKKPALADAPPPVVRAEPPPEFDEFGVPIEPDWSDLEMPAAPVKRDVVRTVAPSGEVLIEARCLQYLVGQPLWVYHVNRKLRQMAADDAHLLNGPLADLGTIDFTDTTHQIVWMALEVAVNQDEIEHALALDQGVPDEGFEVIEQLRASEADRVRASIRARFDGDASMAWMQFQQRLTALANAAQDDFMQTMLRLRLRRIQREREDLMGLLTEAEADGDTKLSRTLGSQQPTLDKAQRRLEAELKQRLR